MFVAGWAVLFLLMIVGGAGDAEADIGGGLLAFLLVVVVAAVWGWYDAHRMDYGLLAVTWGVVGLLMAVIVPLFTALVVSRLDTPVVASDVLVGMPFTAVLVAGPALAAGALALLRSPRRERVTQPGHRAGSPTIRG